MALEFLTTFRRSTAPSTGENAVNTIHCRAFPIFRQDTLVRVHYRLMVSRCRSRGANERAIGTSHRTHAGDELLLEGGPLTGAIRILLCTKTDSLLSLLTQEKST